MEHLFKRLGLSNNAPELLARLPVILTELFAALCMCISLPSLLPGCDWQ